MDHRTLTILLGPVNLYGDLVLMHFQCRVQISTDGFKVYLTAIEEAFGCEVDYGMVVKVYGHNRGR